MYAPPCLPMNSRRALMRVVARTVVRAALSAAWWLPMAMGPMLFLLSAPGPAWAQAITIEPGLSQSLPANTRIIKPAALAASAPVAPQAAAPAAGAHAASPSPEASGLPALSGELGQRIEQMAQDSAKAGSGSGPAARVQIEVGALDPRLRLAPCQKIEPYLPAGLPAWGRTRIGLKCVQGAKAWNVSLPLVVHVWRPGLVLREALPSGTVLDISHLVSAEIDLAAAGTSLPLADSASLLGRTLLRSLAAGSPVRASDLKSRQWFAAGETVKVVAGGPGWAISTEGQALGPGIEGQPIRVRTEAGKTLLGRPVADRLVEVSL